MPWTIKNPPRPAKNWTAEEKRKCVKAANGALKKGSSEKDAIFACISAAGRSTRKEPEMAGNSRQRRKERRAKERRQFQEMKERLETMTGRVHTDEEVKAIMEMGEVPETVFTPDDGKVDVNVDLGEKIDEAQPKEKLKDEKHYGVVEVWTPLGGAQSWDELDTYFEAEDMAHATRKATYEFERMSNNIFNDSSKTLAEKSAAIISLANGLPERVEDIQEEKEADGFLDKVRQFLNPKSVEEEEKPQRSSFKIFKDKAGNWRWFGWVTNKWRDMDKKAAPKHGGEILTEAAHKEYVAWVDKNPEKRMPQLWPWHTKALAHTHKADWIDYADGFLLMSGGLTESEALGNKRLEEHYDLGMSHGFYAIDRDEKEALITKYRTFEVSYLPLEYAANPWTDFLSVEKEADMLKGLTPEKRGFLAKLADEDFVSEVESDTEGKATILNITNIENKANDDEPEDKGDGAEEVQEPSGPVDYKALEEHLKMDELGKLLAGMQGTQKEQGDVLLILAKAVEKLAKDDDLKISETLTPRSDVEKDVEPAWMKSLGQSKDTEVDDEKDKDLIESKPGLKEGHWMEEALAPTADSAAVPR